MGGDFDLVARWMASLRAQDLSHHTIRLYSYGVFRLFTEQVKGSIDTLTEDHIVDFLDSIKDRSKVKSQYVRGIRSLIRFALRRGAMAADPSGGIKIRKPFRPKPVALREDELIRYFVAAAWRDPRRAWTLMAAFGLGTRRMELAAVLPEDVEETRVFLRTCKYRKQRWVELTDYAAIALEELRPWWNGTVIGGISKETITHWAHQAAEDAGLLPKLRGRVAHVLRASFITHLLRNGAPIQAVRDLAGHENIATTNEYAAVFDQDLVDAAKKLRLDTRNRSGAESSP